MDTRLIGAGATVYLPVFAPGEPHKMGWYNRETWRSFVNILYEGGQLSTDKIDPDLLFTNAIADRINDFRVEDVEAAAKNVK